VTKGREQLHTEVFRAESLEDIVTQAQQFFSMMPKLEADSGDAGEDQDPETPEAAG